MDDHSSVGAPVAGALAVRVAAAQHADAVLAALGSLPEGLSSAEAARRLATAGANVFHSRRASPWRVLERQLRSPILILLFVTAGVSMLLGEVANALIIGAILVASIGLGFVNEFRAERAADALHDRIRRTAVVMRDRKTTQEDVADLVPGDIVHLAMGGVVPADIRLLSTEELACDESIVTGESLPSAKSTDQVDPAAGIGDLTCCVLMGTVVHSGTGTGVVVATGSRTEFGQIAVGLSTPQPQTEFQRGLGRFSVLLLEVAVILTTLIFIVNIILHRPILESLLFSLAIAVGITPQLLPAVVSVSLATGSRALARRDVLVKRLVCIEDLGDMDVLVTDKTGTLTEGRIAFTEALPAAGTTTAADLFLLGLLATEADYTEVVGPIPGLNPLDCALWEAPRPEYTSPEHHRRLDLRPFDHERRRTTVLVATPDGQRLVVTKGAPEDVMRACTDIPPEAERMLAERYAARSRVVAVATRPGGTSDALTPKDESGLSLKGFLEFTDRPKADARSSLEDLARLGVAVKIATGDSATVAEEVLADLGFTSAGTLTGTDIDTMDDVTLQGAASVATIFARVSPEQKARIIRLLRHAGRSVGFLGDGVNDVLALHQADIGISVETAADVAKDAADVLLLDKDLGVLADGVTEGRRIFANTVKYVLMGTSSNFGNMFSAALASLVLPFLPMLPSQILLNNLLYDTGQLAIPGDRVDREQLESAAHWDIRFIRRFMLLFGPISSFFDFATFALMLFVFRAVEGEFQAGWFIESIATQSLIILAIRTRRTPFFRSRPSPGLVLAALAVVAAGVWLPYSPISGLLGFRPLPAPFFLVLVVMVVAYLVCVELAKVWFFRNLARRERATPARPRTRAYPHRVQRRASGFTEHSPQRGRRVEARTR